MACRELNLLPYSRDDRNPTVIQKSPFQEVWVHTPSKPKIEVSRSCRNLYVQKTNGKDGLLRMDQLSLLKSIKTCTFHKDLPTGDIIHSHVTERGLFHHNISIGNALLSMYAKCDALTKAQEVFDELPTRNVVSWNALISAFAQHGLLDEALESFVRMQDEGLAPNAITFVCLLKACHNLGAVEKIHAEVGRQSSLEEDVALGTALVNAYVKMGAFSKAQALFDKLPVQNVATWTALIDGYAQHGLGEKALRCFEKMRGEGLSPNAVTYICTLKACGSIGAVEKGEQIHAEVSRRGWVENNAMLGTALVDMYAKCGALTKAQLLFDKLRSQDVVTWNALLAGYAQHGLGEEALGIFKRMSKEGPSPNSVSFICILKACSSIGAGIEGEEIHAELGRQGLPGKDIVLGTALVDMYVNCGALSKAQAVFDNLPARTVVTWNALIGGYAEHGHDEEALSSYKRMGHEGTSPNAVTFVCVLKACSNIGATEQGEEIHSDVSRKGLLKKDSALGNALVDMYAKCGLIAKAQGVFDMLPACDVTAWNALIAGYAQVGKVSTAFDLYMKMVQKGIKPDVVTFIVLLTTCSHAGLVEEGSVFFNTMCNLYGIMPTLEHLTCMVDIFSRAGLLGKALSVIEIVPPSSRLLLWTALMSACQRWLHVELGRWIFGQAVRLDENLDATYISMSNIYAAAGKKKKTCTLESSVLLVN